MNGDVLDDEGIGALDACVKVSIYGKPENTRKYHWETAVDRLDKCYAGGDPGRNMWNSMRCLPPIKELMLPKELDEEGIDENPTTYDIIGIHDALAKFDELPYVEKYPKRGPRYDELKALIDERRADIERECQEAIADPDGRRRYSWLVAQRRVRDCFAGSFAGDKGLLSFSERWHHHSSEPHNIIEIYNAVVSYENLNYINICLTTFFDYKEDGEPEFDKLKESAQTHSFGVKKEYQDAICKLRKYSKCEAEQRVRQCFESKLNWESKAIIPVNEDESGEPNINIFDIHEGVLRFEKRDLDNSFKTKSQFTGKKPKFSNELMLSAKANKDAVIKEYQEAKSRLPGYSRSDAERRVRDCYAGAFLRPAQDTDIFPFREEINGIPKMQQTYDIFEIKKAINHFDEKKLRDRYLEKKDPESLRSNQLADEQRAEIEREYIEATAKIEIDHGSGFAIHDHFVITNKHVIEDAVYDKTKKVCISNAAIGELPCEVAEYDAGKDLALLYCQDLDLKQNGICSLQLSNQSLTPGMQIFCFGYPISHTGETALFVNGYVSGSKKTYSGHTIAVLNCSLNSGNSGGPVLRWVNGDLKVVGVATQKHIKDILTLQERTRIEKIRKSLETSTIQSGADNFYVSCRDCRQTPINLLTLKLYDALETHSQFNLSNAVTGHYVVEFIKETICKYKGEGKEELTEIVESEFDISKLSAKLSSLNLIFEGRFSTPHRKGRKRGSAERK